jgi:uncharacterized protein YbjQ (UPF0145 family)
MIISTVDLKKNYEVLGLVKGSTIRAKHIGKDILSAFKHIIGGELREYTGMLREARQQSQDRMIEDAKLLKADTVIGVRFVTSQVMQGAAEIVCYGTAVKFKK